MKGKMYPYEPLMLGSQRVVRRFLVFPICLPIVDPDGRLTKEQWRWLELADIEQIYGDTGFWHDQAFVDGARGG